MFYVTLNRILKATPEQVNNVILMLICDALANVKGTHRGVLLLVTLHAKACNYAERNTPP